MKKVAIIAIFVIGIIIVAASALIGVTTQVDTSRETTEADVTGQPESSEFNEQVREQENFQITEEIAQSFDCTGSARCFTGKVTGIIDGDTIKVAGQSIRFALSSAPEIYEEGGIKAKEFLENVCPIGSTVLVDEDDEQTQGSFGRILAVIYCNDMNLNEAVLDVGLATISTSFCSYSEFSNSAWAKKHGCNVKSTDVVIPQKKGSCDPSYPDVCIPPYPPDLDCGEISYKNFRVIGSDPHGFDADNDEIGCEN